MCIRDRLRLAVPVFGSLYRAFLTRQFAAAMALTYRAGMPVSEAVGQLGAAFEDPVCREALRHVERQIQQGVHLHAAVAQTRFFPELVVHMLRVGETGGKMDEVLEKLERHYGERLETAVKRFTQLLEPCLIFLVAALVGWIVAAMYAPLFNLGFAL